MKKSISVSILAIVLVLATLSLASCEWLGGFLPWFKPDEEEVEYVDVVDSDGNTVSAVVNPTRVAIYDYSILDILDNVGFENTGIEKLVVPTKSSLPGDLSYYADLPDSKVVSGGTLFYVDQDVLDLVQPQLVILGGRSFGMNANGDRLTSDVVAADKEAAKAKYSQTAFVKLSVNASNSNFTGDMEKNVAALAKIFPSLKAALEEKLAEIKAGIAEIREAAQTSGATALFCMMVDQTTLSVFNVDSRFDMLYEDFGFTPVDPLATVWGNQHGLEVRAEYVLEQNPDVIFVLDRSATVGTGAGFGNFMATPLIQETEAYRNGNIYVLTGEAWYTMTGGFTAATRMIADLNQFLAD
ncbi:MAG: ABC transporter substrate-binding protein [Clostridiales bacterium]|jgi:iron complex transport system substrate-binding protein|nr:ABC transporter substrate-binding protein [Clostridiales bacterium]